MYNANNSRKEAIQLDQMQEHTTLYGDIADLHGVSETCFWNMLPPLMESIANLEGITPAFAIKDEAALQEIADMLANAGNTFTVLIDLTGHLQPHLLDALYAHIQSVPHADYTSHTLILLRGFAVSALQSVHNPLKARRWYGLEEFWQLMQPAAPPGCSTGVGNFTRAPKPEKRVLSNCLSAPGPGQVVMRVSDARCVRVRDRHW